MRVLFLVFLTLCIASCEVGDNKTPAISIQGIPTVNVESLKLNGLQIDTVLFADGNEHVILKGSIYNSNDLLKYALHFDKSPWLKDAKLVYTNVPFEEMHGAHCVTSFKGKFVEIVWTFANKRIFLRDKLT